MNMKRHDFQSTKEESLVNWRRERRDWKNFLTDWSKEEETAAFNERYKQLDNALCGEKLSFRDGISLSELQQLLKSCGEYLGKIDKRDDGKNRSDGDAKKQKKLSARPKVRL